MKRLLIGFAFLLPLALAQRPPTGGQIVGVSGNGNTSVTSTGAQTPGACVVIDANGNHVAGLCNSVRNHQSQLPGVLANGTDQALFTYSVPAGTMGAAGCIHAEFAFQQSAGGGTPKFWFGSTAVTIYPGSGDTSIWITSVRVCNNAGAIGAQQIVANVGRLRRGQLRFVERRRVQHFSAGYNRRSRHETDWHGRNFEHIYSDRLDGMVSGPLSVIIPSRTAANLIPCVEAVRRHEPEARIVIVDDTPDLSLAPRPDWMPAVTVEGVRPFIYARNCNFGIRTAGSDDVILLNDDALLESAGGFTAMQRAAELHPEYGVIGAVTNVTGQPLQRPHGIGLREVPHIAFVCVLIPRRTIDRIGLLDERYCLDYGVEDLDYCEATRRAGLKVAVFDSCYVDHGRLTSSFRGDPSNPRSFAKNKALFDAKWRAAA